MTVRQHPSDETLMRYAAGILGAGLRLVVAIHLESCPVCRAQCRQFAAAGGIMLETLPPDPVRPVLLEKIFARIDAGEAEPRSSPRALAQVFDNGFVLPAALAAQEIGPWRRVHPRLRWAQVRLPAAPGERVVLLKIAAGHAAPAHGHRGLELTQVLYGQFSDGRGVYGPGDLIEADETIVDHQPVVTPDGECLCIAALEAPLRVNSLLGRLFQPLMGL